MITPNPTRRMSLEDHTRPRTLLTNGLNAQPRAIAEPSQRVTIAVTSPNEPSTCADTWPVVVLLNT